MAQAKIQALTAKQNTFVQHYLANGFNATQAAKDSGYSEKTAYSQGQRLLKNVEIQKYLQIAKEEVRTRCGYTQDMLVKELETAQQMAMATDNPSAYIKATEVKSKLLGLNEPKEIEMKGGLTIDNVTFK